MLIFGTHSVSKDLLREIKKYHIGGILLHKNDFQSPSDLLNLTNHLQKASEIPLLIASDEEGGLVTRLTPFKGFIYKHSAETMGERGLEYTNNAATSIATELSLHGVNLNFAPVVDVAINPKNTAIVTKGRSFSDDPDDVSQLATEFVNAHSAQNILTTLKHFPGHGSSMEDSHHAPVDITKTWSDIELTPFRNMIKNGSAHLIMMGHLLNTEYDSQHPASLSEKVHQILRVQLKFDGVVISDDFQMKAITKNYKLKETIKLAINAGTDILLFGQIQEYYPISKIHGIIKKLVKNNEVSMKRINESYQRIIELKQKANLISK